ncbi:MAG: type I-B CRISPR-associated protein Cas7/Cst2/DevR [Thermosphaera sp.]
MKKILVSILVRVKGNVNANGSVAALTEIKKFFTTDGETRVYVSGRCVKYCIKQRLSEKGFELSPLQKPKKVAISMGDPVSYIDDDLFGFMMAEVAGEAARRRFAPIKTDGIVALRHCEITRDFGGRFDPAGRVMPSPFEVEVADFIGQNNWIITENVSRFESEELSDDIIKNAPVKLEEKNEGGKKVYYLPSNDQKYGRRNRLKAFLEVLLKERYVFPRCATSLHQPYYYYIVILPTERLLPLFAHVDYDVKNGRVMLNLDKIEALGSLLDENEKITIIDFENILGEEIRLRIEDYKRRVEGLKPSDEALKALERKIKILENIEVVGPSGIDDVISRMINYLVRG